MAIKNLALAAILIAFGVCALAASNGATAQAAPLDGWTALANGGLNENVIAILTVGTDMYVAGAFTGTQDGNVAGLNHIARWDGSSWHPLGFGLDDFVFALAVDSAGNVYAGGRFSGACANAACSSTGAALNNVAMWNGTAWTALGGGLNNEISALVIAPDDSMYAGGNFDAICSPGCTTTARRVARWNGAAWNALGFGIADHTVFALALDADGNVFAGGNFQFVCGDAACGDEPKIATGQLAKFNGSSWSGFPAMPIDNKINVLTFVGADLYIGGDFDDDADNTLLAQRTAPEGGGPPPSAHIVRFDGAQWHALPNSGLNGNVQSIVVHGSDLYVSGDFSASEDGSVSNLNRVARLSGGVWSPLLNQGLNGGAQALAQGNGSLYAGGSFSATYDGEVSGLNHIAAYPVGCGSKPTVPNPSKPRDDKTVNTIQPVLKWAAAGCADTYTIIVKNNATGEKVDKATGLTELKYKTDTLTQGVTYKWFVKACNANGCAKSETRTFKVK